MTRHLPTAPAPGASFPEAARPARRRALIAGAAGFALAALLGALSARHFLESYLLAFVFWLGLSLGGLAILSIHFMTGGRWGAVARRSAEACSRTLPLMGILFLPLAAGVSEIYPWAREGAQLDPHAAARARYLNAPAFRMRGAAYFVIWILLAYALNRLADQRERASEATEDLRRLGRMQRLSGVTLAAYGLTVSFAAIDWIMSLENGWGSSIFGGVIGFGFVLSAFAFAILTLAAASRDSEVREALTPSTANDLGALLLAFVMIWAYLSFSQFLLIWMANLAEETPWVARRTTGAWGWIAAGLLVFHFAIPFLILLSRGVKRRVGSLAAAAGWILAMRLLDLIWTMVPSFGPRPWWTPVLDAALLVGVGGVWLALYLWILERRPLLPRRDAGLPHSQQAGGGAHG